MNLTPEMKQQLAEQKKQCIFCKIIDKEQDSKIVFEDDLSIAVLDIFPAMKGHTVFMQKEHYPIMPYLQPHEFIHLFGTIPALAKAIKKAMLSTAINVFIANGGVAGQRAPHFLIHLFPRENGDGFTNFLLKKGEDLKEDQVKMLQHNFPLMMQNHFGRQPTSWHTGKGDVPAFLSSIHEKETIIYEDEKALVVIPTKNAAPGHLRIYSKEEEKSIEKFDHKSAAHLFYVASYGATAVFEGLGAHGTNIIMKSGESDDNQGGKLFIDILPRWQDDSLQQLMWEPKQPSYNLDDVKSKIKDKTWQVNHKPKEKKEEAHILTKAKPMRLGETTRTATAKPKNSQDEIHAAITKIRDE